MLRKVFTSSGVVVAVAEVGSTVADVTHPGADNYQFVSTDATHIAVGDVFDGVNYSAPIPTPAQIAAQAVAQAQAKQAAIEAAMLHHFDVTAQSRRYDNRITCALRAGYPGPFHAEGLAFASWMDECNATAYGLLAEVQAGTRPMPESASDALALLPAMVWP